MRFMRWCLPTTAVVALSHRHLVRRRPIFSRLVIAALFGGALNSHASDAQTTRSTGPIPDRTAQRRQFQDQELVTAKPFSVIFNPGEAPRIVWRDLETVRELGRNGRLRVRWFDADLNEVDVPKRPGRWCA